MAIKTMYDIIEAGYQFTNIQRFSVGENPVSLPVRLFYKEGMTIRHDGVTMLTESDYLATEIDQPLTDRFGKTVYKKLFITNSNYQSGMIEITFTGVGDFLKSTDISDIKNEIDTKFNRVGGEIEGNITVRDIMPNMVGASNGVSTRNIGSATQKFNAVYADEVFVGASSLYVNGKKVIEDISNTMEFKTSIDQGMAIKTISTTPGSGSGNLSLSSGNIIDLSGRGGINITTPAGVSNKNVTISSESSNGQVMLSSLTEIDVTAPVIDLNGAVQASSLIVEGNLTVSGTTTTINTQTLTIQDNIIELNNNQSGIPPSGLISGISVNRGDSPVYRFVFKESDDTFRIGEVGFEQAVATRQDSPTANGIAFWNNTSKRFDTIAGLTYSGSIINGTITNANKFTTARTINNVSFDGSADITITAVNPYSLTKGSYLTGLDYNGSVATTWAVDATSGNNANKIVARDASGNFSAGTITANLVGNCSGSSGSCTGNAATVTTLTKAQIEAQLTGSITSHTHTSAGISDATSVNTANMIVKRDASGGFNAGNINAANLTLSGNLTVNGTTTSIDTTNLLIEDNVVILNKNQTGIPATSLISGLEVERGDATNYQFMFRELDDTFVIGESTSLQAVATRQDSPTANAVPIWNNTSKRFDTTSVTISGSTITGTLSGTATSANQVRGVNFHADAIAPSGTTRLNMDGYFYATRVYNAVYNDLAEFMFKAEDAEPGMVLVMDGGKVKPCVSRGDAAVVGVYSDTYGYALGAEDSESKLPIGISGRVNVWIEEPCKTGDLLITSDKKGFATVKRTGEDGQGKVFAKVLQNKTNSTPERIEVLILMA